MATEQHDLDQGVCLRYLVKEEKIGLLHELGSDLDLDP